MKRFFMIFVAVFLFASCANTSSVDVESRQESDNPKTDFNINDYIGIFNKYEIGEGPKLIIQQENEKEFTIINENEYGGKYRCMFDGKIFEDWGTGELHPGLFFDCVTITSNYDSWVDRTYLTPYISLRRYTSEYSEHISIDTYLYGKEYYKKCSANEDKQACKYRNAGFSRQKIGN